MSETKRLRIEQLLMRDVGSEDMPCSISLDSRSLGSAGAQQVQEPIATHPQGGLSNLGIFCRMLHVLLIDVFVT